MTITVVAVITPQPDAVEAVADALAASVPGTHAEDGCEFYQLTRGDGRLVTIEKWRDRAALDAHLAGPGIAALLEQAGPLLAAAPDVMVLEPVAAGDPAKSTF